MAMRLAACVAAAALLVSPSNAIVTKKGNLKELLDRLSSAEASHPMTLEEFTPICLQHVNGLIRAIDLAYTDAQLGHTLKGECKLSHAFPSAYEHGYANQCACLSFSDQLVKARDVELANGDTKAYKAFCAAFHGHGTDVEECKPPPAKLASPAAQNKAAPGSAKKAGQENAKPVAKDDAMPFDNKLKEKKPEEKVAEKAAVEKHQKEEKAAKVTQKKATEKAAVEKKQKQEEAGKKAVAEQVAAEKAAEEHVASKKVQAKKAAKQTADAPADDGAGASQGGGAAQSSAGAAAGAGPASQATAGGAPSSTGSGAAAGAGPASQATAGGDYEERAQIPEEEIDGMEKPEKNKHAEHWQNMRERGRRYGSQYRMESTNRGDNYKHDDTPPRQREEWESTAITHASHHDMPQPVEEPKEPAPAPRARSGATQGFVALSSLILIVMAA